MGRSAVPRPTPEDMAAWRGLAAAILTAVRAPRAPAKALERARRATKLKVVPNGPPTKDHPVVRMAKMADRYLAETAGGREALAAELEATAEACAPLLDLTPGRGGR